MPTFVLNNKFRGQNKADYEDAYFDYMNNSNAVANYPLTTKREYIKGVRETRNAQYNPLNPLETNLPDYSRMFDVNQQNLKISPSYGIDLSFLQEPRREVNGPFLENYVRPVQYREEQEIEDADEAEAMEYGRRNLIQQQFTPIEKPNYTQQAILPTQSPADIFNQNRNSIIAQKAAENKELKKQIRKENRKQRWANFNEKWDNGLGQTVGGIAQTGASIGNAFIDASLSDNQKAVLSGTLAFNNDAVDSINGVRQSLNATDFNQLQGQYNNQNSILNGFKTAKLSNGQIGGMTATGAASGAAAGSAFGPWGTVIGAGVGAAAGLGKGLLANKKIGDINDAASFRQQGLNNSYLATAQNIKNINANNKKLDMFNNEAYIGAKGGYLYANGGLMNPYGINEFNTGHKHENNKFGGIPVSIAEDGKPNLVEEGEVLYDDYVYSNRIKINDTIRRRLKLKDDVKTFADAAKEVKERGDDRPNDPVTEKTIKAQMQFLKSEQDKKKEQQEEREQQKMMAQMNEQQLQAMQEQQMNEGADAYEQQMAQQQMTQQQQMQQPEEQMFAQDVPQEGQQQMFAKGGNLQGGSDDVDAHRFAGEEDRWKDYDWSNFDFSKIFNDDTYQYINKRNNKAFDFGANKADEETKKAYELVFNNDNEYTDDYNNLISSLKGMSDDNKAKFLEGYKNLWKKYHGSDFTGDFNEAMTKLEDKKWGNAHAAMSKILQQKPPQQETPPEEPKTYKGDVEKNPNYTWKYRQNYIPLGIDAALAAQSFAPADYSRANSIINTPIRDIQYKPIGGHVAPYIIDPRLQYQMNADLGAATNRGLINNAGGNSAAAQAALLANNRQISQSAANLGYQADAQNASQIQAARQFNSQIDQTNSQGFLEAARANQAADVQRGEFNYYGQNMKENIDAQRGQAISNSMQSLADDSMKLSKDRYNQGMMAGLVDSGYFGEATPFIRQMAGFTPTGEVTTKNYLLDDYGNRHYVVNNAGTNTYNFENPNNDLMKQNVGKTLVFENGEYKFV